AVDEQVATRAHAAEFDGLDRVGQLSPVAEYVGAGSARIGSEREQAGEVVLAGDLRTGALVDGADAEFGGPAQRGELRVSSLSGGDRAEGSGAYRVVGVARERAVLGVSGGRAGFRSCVEQRAGDDGAVHVDAGEVGAATARRAIQLGSGERFAPVRRAVIPRGLVPAGTEYDC